MPCTSLVSLLAVQNELLVPVLLFKSTWLSLSVVMVLAGQGTAVLVQLLLGADFWPKHQYFKNSKIKGSRASRIWSNFCNGSTFVLGCRQPLSAASELPVCSAWAHPAVSSSTQGWPYPAPRVWGSILDFGGLQVGRMLSKSSTTPDLAEGAV